MSFKKKLLTTKKSFVLTCAALALFPATSHAQLSESQSQAVSGTANPSRITSQIDDPNFVPGVSPRVDVKDLILQDIPEGAENIKFTLTAIQLDGVNVYTETDVRSVYADKLGQEISLADVYAISSALTNKYRNDGYILTQVIVPPQEIDGGVVTLRAVEGFINDVSVRGGEDNGSLDLILEYASGIKTGKALNVSDLERYLLLINDLPGVSARSVLNPSENVVGGADLLIIVERNLIDAFVGVDNYGSRYLGPLQFTAAASANSFFDNNERLTFQTVIAPDSGELEVGFFSIGYQQPLPNIGFGLGTQLDVLGSFSVTEPGFDLKSFDVEGRSQFVSVKLSHPFIRSRTTNLTGSFGLDWRNVKSSNNIPAIIDATRRDSIRAARIGVNYDFLDTLFGPAGAGVNAVGLEFSRGLDIFGASSKGAANLTRAAGNPEFTKLNGNIQRLQRVTSDVNLLIAAEGQWSATPLLSSEEFGVGGIGNGRGFDPSEITGDDGIAGKVEVQWNEPYRFKLMEDYQLYGFYDAGRTFNQDATSRSLKKDTATSTGFGVRADFAQDVEAGLVVAFPLNRDVQTQSDRDPRFFVNLSRSF